MAPRRRFPTPAEQVYDVLNWAAAPDRDWDGTRLCVGGQSAVVHKTGTLDEVDNDAALVVSGPNGPYTLTVMTDGLGEDSAWQLIASISQTVWSFEGARAK